MNFIQKWIVQLVGAKIGLKEDNEKTMDTKKWYLSKTILASIVTILISIVTLYGQITGNNLMSTPMASSILAVLGAIGIYGRATADKTIG